ncbi:hypothetical protein V8C37DRAFT_395429 [Trichoderma ceciliae]
MALPDVFHQLHCLNHLRKMIYKQSYRAELEDGELLEAHNAHCIDSIRLSFECSADTSLITFDWIAGYPIPWPNFSTTHKCRDWDKLLDWARVEYEKMVTVSKEGGGVNHPILGLPKSNGVYKIPLKEEDVHYIDTKGAAVIRQ